MPKPNPLNNFLKSNRSILVDAAVKTDFLQHLDIDKNRAYSDILSIFYKSRMSKQKKYIYIETLNKFWNANKDDLTKEILDLQNKNKNSVNLKQNLSNKQSDFSSSNDDFNLSENECDSEVESLVSDSEEEKETVERDAIKLDHTKESEYRNLQTVSKIKRWSVSEAAVKHIFDLKSYKMLDGWYNFVIDEFITKHNPHCVFVIKRSHLKKKNSNKKNLPLFKAKLTCKHSTCETVHIFTIGKT